LTGAEEFLEDLVDSTSETLVAHVTDRASRVAADMGDLNARLETATAMLDSTAVAGSHASADPESYGEEQQQNSQTHMVEGVSALALVLQVCVAVLVGTLVETWRWKGLQERRSNSGKGMREEVGPSVQRH